MGWCQSLLKLPRRWEGWGDGELPTPRHHFLKLWEDVGVVAVFPPPCSICLHLQEGKWGLLPTTHCIVMTLAMPQANHLHMYEIASQTIFISIRMV